MALVEIPQADREPQLSKQHQIALGIGLLIFELLDLRSDHRASIPNFDNRDESVVAQPALLKSIARVFHEIRWSKYFMKPEVVDKFLADLPALHFSHNNRLWDVTHLKDSETEFKRSILPGYTLGDYMGVRWAEKEIARTISGKVHFGTRHNESILVLPHIVRFLAGLPPQSIDRQGEGKSRT